jgi:hypothetical protein
MFKSLDIQEHMEVVGSDGKHIGTVDHTECGDRVLSFLVRLHNKWQPGSGRAFAI